MHNHNNKDGGHKRMLWMMIPCLLLLGFVFFGGNKLSSNGYLWPILIGAFVFAHIWMMFKGHGGHNNNNDTENKNNGTSVNQSERKNEDNKHKGGGCCH